jgi:hypothetical protein
VLAGSIASAFHAGHARPFPELRYPPMPPTALGRRYARNRPQSRLQARIGGHGSVKVTPLDPLACSERAYSLRMILAAGIKA